MTYKTGERTLIYNCKDAIVQYDCAEAFFDQIDKPAAPGKNTYRETYNHTLSLYEPCMYMQSRGIKVDIEALNREKTNISKRIDSLGEEINKLCGYAINPASPDQLKKYFYVLKGISPYTKLNENKESVITCDDKALQRIARGTSARSGLREASLIQEWRKLSKLKGTYLEISFDDDKRLRCSYNPRGTRFARLSSSKTIFETGMNNQNLHPDFLSFLVADEDCCFISLDKRQAEWVVVAYVTGDENMINAVEQGLDVHAYTASQMCGVPIEVVKEEDEALGHTSDPEEVLHWRQNHPLLSKLVLAGRWLPRSMSMRQCGKKSNHGLNYDETYRMFALINELIEKEAKSIVEFYHNAYTGIRRYYDFTKSELQRNGRVLENLFGRPYRFSGPWDSELWKSAYSFIPQSTIGELVNRGMSGVYYDKTETLSNLEIMQQVHDNILFQHPIGDNNLGAAIARAKMHLEPSLKSGGREFTIATDLTVGYNLRDMKKVPLVDNHEKQTQLVRDALAKLAEEANSGVEKIG